MLEAGSYIPNDLTMDEDTSIYLITGPNMSGKSTYMRQMALIAIMAQVGSFVPAEAATLPILTRSSPGSGQLTTFIPARVPSW